MHLQHDSLGARSLPGKTDKTVFTDLWLLGDFVSPAGQSALIELHRNDFDGGRAGIDVGGFNASLDALQVLR